MRDLQDQAIEDCLELASACEDAISGAGAEHGIASTLVIAAAAARTAADLAPAGSPLGADAFALVARTAERCAEACRAAGGERLLEIAELRDISSRSVRELGRSASASAAR